jgi:S1-C subfamily serine protease
LPEFSLKNKIIKVFLADGQEFIAEIKNENTFNGLLILKIEADNLPVAPFGESNNLDNGEKLILVGQATFDNKPIFALRAIQEHSKNFSKKGMKFLFSDENSEVFVLDNIVSEQFIGGAAVDFNGTIIGLINNTKNINGESSFIIPLENVKKSIKNTFTKDNKEKSIFGVYYLNINEKLSIANDLPVDEGALVYNPSGKNGLAVLTGLIGQEIGLKIYDIITHVNRIKIDRENTLSEILSTQDLNVKVEIKIIRNGKKMELTREIK